MYTRLLHKFTEKCYGVCLSQKVNTSSEWQRAVLGDAQLKLHAAQNNCQVGSLHMGPRSVLILWTKTAAHTGLAGQGKAGQGTLKTRPLSAHSRSPNSPSWGRMKMEWPSLRLTSVYRADAIVASGVLP